MTARIISIKTDRQAALEAALALFDAGDVVALPTETVYGLAGDATNPKAITGIYDTKGRPRFNPLIAHMADLAMAERHVEFDALSRRLAEQFWPGPLTLVLPLRKDSPIHPLATAGLETAAVRVPEGFAAELIAAFDRPLAAPSANSSGGISPTDARHVADDLGGKIKLILDGGRAAVGVESTILKPAADGVHLLRPGGLSAEAIEAVIGSPLIRPKGPATTLEAPGMMLSHYAPNALMRLNAVDVRPDEALLNFARQTIAGTPAFALDLSPSGDLHEAAANLFAAMKQADASGASLIAVAPIPDHGLGEAINDRLMRAAAPRP